MSFQVHAQFFRSFRGQQLVSNSPLKSFVWWLLFLFHLEFNYKKHSNRLYSCQCDISSIFFKKKLYGSEFKFKKHSNRLYRGQCNIPSISSKKNFIAQNSNLRNIQIVFIAANVIFRVFSSKKNFMPPFRFKCLKSTEPLQVSSSLFITQFREIPGTDFINLGRIKG